MNKNLKLVLIAALSATFAASAHTTTNALVDSSGSAVRGGFNQCIEAQYNTDSAECGAVMDVEFNLGAHTLFDFNKSNLRAEGKAELNALAGKIKEGRDLGKIKSVVGVEVVGHTDGIGSQKYNQGLSERRAASVANYLVSLGVPANIISARGMGKLEPIATNKTAAGRQQNRRVNITVSGVAVDNK